MQKSLEIDVNFISSFSRTLSIIWNLSFLMVILLQEKPEVARSQIWIVLQVLADLDDAVFY